MSGGLLTEARTRLPEALPGASLGESVRAAGAEAFLAAPLSSLLRRNELDAAYELGRPVDAATARQRLRDAGLDGHLTVGDQGISDLALEVLIQRKRDELKRREAIETGPQGFGPASLRFAGAFGASLLDPLNVATAFVPVVGEARYAQLLRAAGSAYGRAGVRAGIGAAEGVVGAALVEPLILSAKEQEQADYTMADSLANIAFGTVFGGGLHVAGGAFADAFRPPSYWKSRLPDDIPGAAVPAGTFFGDLGAVKVGDQYLGARWALVDAAEVEASLTKGDNQFRDRTRAASDTQVLEIARKLDFNLLNASPVMDVGAPTLAKDGRVIGGNGRIAAIGRAYELGSNGPYTEALLANLERFGIAPDQAAGMKKPALVRVLEDEVDVRAAAMASNEGGSARMSALEQAGVDAGRLPDMRALDINADGQILSASNRAFIRSWVGEFPKTQQPALLDADGALSAEGLTRLRNAILLKAYGDSPTLRRLVEATDPGSRNVAAALTRAAPRLAETADAIASGDLHRFDLSRDVQAAVEKLAQLREQGETVGDYLRQGQLVADALGPEARLLLSFMDRNIRAPARIAELLTGFYDGVRALGNPKQAGMFGDALPTTMDLLLQAVRRAEEGGATAADVLARVSPQTREAALRVAVAQAAEGKVVDVEALVMADPRASVAEPAIPMRGEPLPMAGLATANLGADGVVYVGRKGALHFQIAEKFRPVGGFTDFGFVTPDGRFLDREEALAWVNANEGLVQPSENMHGQLDAIDYREQIKPASSGDTGRLTADYSPGRAQSDLVAAAQRQLLPESDSLAAYATPRDPEAAPLSPGQQSELEEAEALLSEALGRIQRRAGGDPKVQAAIAKGLKPFDDDIALADHVGKVLQAGAQCMGRFA